MARARAGSPFTTTDRSLEQISPRAFGQLRELIHAQAGIQLSDSKRGLVCARLARRVRQLGLSNYDDYYHLLLCDDPAGGELQQLLNCISTTKTEFFRESHHFDFLRDNAVPAWRAIAARPSRELRLWSAGCSKGHEPYSIAMTLLEHFPLFAAWDVRILATDINTDVLRIACDGVYPIDEISGTRSTSLEKWMLKGTGPQAGRCRVRDEVQRLVTFRPLNLMTTPWPMSREFDAIFCRNVLIYFDEPTQRRLIRNFAGKLSPSDYLFIGHSEHRVWMSEYLEPLGQTTYRRRVDA